MRIPVVATIDPNQHHICRLHGLKVRHGEADCISSTLLVLLESPVEVYAVRRKLYCMCRISCGILRIYDTM